MRLMFAISQFKKICGIKENYAGIKSYQTNI